MMRELWVAAPIAMILTGAQAAAAASGSLSGPSADNFAQACDAPSSSNVVSCSQSRGPQMSGNGGAEGAAAPSGGSPWTGLRVRGADTSLTIPNTDRSLSFAFASGATLGWSKSGPSSGDAETVYFGYDFQKQVYADDNSSLSFDFVPIAAIDRQVSGVNGQPSATARDNRMAGGVFGITNAASWGGNYGSAVYYHLWNNINNSELNFISLTDTPYLARVINNNAFSPRNSPGFEMGLVLNAHLDRGIFSAHGLAPAATQNFTQAGATYGLGFLVPFPDPDFSTKIVVTQTSLHVFTAARKDIETFYALLMFSYLRKYSIYTSYTNGTVPSTGQRISQYTAAISIKY